MNWQHPVFVLCRDRLETLKGVVGWLEQAGYERIELVDSESSYEPTREWLADSPHPVHWCANGKEDLVWGHGLAPDGPFAICGCDLLPMPECPPDIFPYLEGLLNRYPVSKAGAGIVYDDLTPGLGREGFAGRLGADTIAELRSFETTPAEPGVFLSCIDHTFTVCRAGSARWNLDAARTGRPSPYLVRHLPWYETHPLTPDVKHYLAHALRGRAWSSWAQALDTYGS
jgi:hypothetical protein